MVLAFGLVTCQALTGGARLVLALPGYLAVGLAAVICAYVFRGERPGKGQAGCLACALALALYVMVRGSFSPVPYLARQDLLSCGAALIVYLLSG